MVYVRQGDPNQSQSIMTPIDHFLEYASDIGYDK